MIAPRDRIVRLFTDHFGSPPTAIRDVASDASSRSYVRLIGTEGQTAVGAVGPDPDENRAFLGYSRDLHASGLRVPELYAADEKVGVWLAEDLGDTTLFDVLTAARERTGERFPSELAPTYRRVFEELVRLQFEGALTVDFSVAYPRADFDEQSILWDLSYFKYHFLKLAHVPFNEERLERDFRSLAAFLVDTDTSHFLHRDFQARNIMLRDGEPWFIDYQGGRRGALQYDVASLLYSGSSDLPEEARDELLETYIEALSTQHEIDRSRFVERYRGYALARVMQALGTYGYRGLFERKSRFVARIPAAARSLRAILSRGMPVPLPEIRSTVRRIVDRWADVDDESRGAEGRRLVVHVSSFSYRGGYPEDAGGHGGGFVFDCRALPNPGREEQYLRLSGLDAPVIEYLDREDRVSDFWESARTLAEGQIAEYLRREFTNLSIAFGCTGGQHRSVYMAEKLAAHLRRRFADRIQVRLRHRESLLWPSRDEL